jgi:AP2 domain
LGNNKQGRSGFFGVTWNASARKWAVQIKLGTKTKYLGLFVDPEKAARHYDKHAKKEGKTLLNFPWEK